MARFCVLRQLIYPSVVPLFQGSVTAFRRASRSLLTVRTPSDAQNALRLVIDQTPG